VGVHGVGGTWGALATGLFASKAINDAGANGLFYGNAGQVWIQLVGILATWVFAFVGTLVLLKVVDVLVGLRVNDEEEFLGLDVSQHSENAYAFEVSGYGGGHGASVEPAPRREPVGQPATRPTPL
jgi:Amt family ammonium transporter